MVSLLFIVQILIASILIFFISGRLIGSEISLMKRMLSVVVSVAFTTFVFWYSYLRDLPVSEENYVENVVNTATLLWFGSMLLISMLLFLIFELFSTVDFIDGSAEKQSFLRKMISYWKRQKRLREVVSIAMKNGVTRTVHYARHRDNERELAVALRVTLEQCGGIFVKFGQVLSTRNELFSPIFIDELQKLQQNVPPLSAEQVDLLLKENLKMDASAIFSYFNPVPLAAASIGQVHKAILRDTNEPVVVKLLRPDVKDIMREDLTILVEFASWISSKSQWADSLGFRELAAGFAQSLREEIDFNIEARNMIQVATVMKNAEQYVKIPRMYEAYSNENLLVMEYVDGQSVAFADEVFTACAVDRHLFAQQLLFVFLEQLLVSGIFHADPHPGNIYIEKHTGAITLLDLGAVGRLAAQQQEGLKLFLAGIDQNNAGLIFDGVTLLVENADEGERAEIEQAISQIMLRISYVDRIPTDDLIYSLFSVVREFGLHFYPSVSVALRAIVTLDGTLTSIDANFDIFSEAKEYSNAYVKSSLKKPFKEPLEMKERLEAELALILPAMRKLPRRMDQLFKKVEGGKIILHHDIFSDKANTMFVTQLFSRFVLLLVGITFGIISVALLAISQFMHTAYAVYLNTASYLGLFLCAILLVRLSIQAIRDIKRTS